MKAIGGFLLTVVVVALVAVGAGFFFLPKVASKTETVQIAKPAASVYALLASAPAGEKIAEGATQTLKSATPPDTVVFDVTYADGSTGLATYKVTAKSDTASEVALKLEKPLGSSPMDRLSGLTGAPVAPFISGATKELSADAAGLLDKPFTGLVYEVVTVEPGPYIYSPGESTQDAAEIKKWVASALEVVDLNVKRGNVRTVGRPVAVENAWTTDNKYQFNAGYRISGRAPTGSAGVLYGQMPAGPAIKVHYTGDESQVLPTYDKMEALVAAGRLKLGKSFEIYNDEPTVAGGSVDREIYYLVEGGDVNTLAKILPPAASTPSTTAAATPASTTP